MNEKQVGYWRSADGRMYSELPRVEDFIDATWDPQERARVVVYLQKKKFEDAHYRGMSKCRCCGKYNGSSDLTDGTYRWPSGFAHYLTQHNVKPPQDFIDHVLAQEPSEGERRAALRNPNYENMSAREQWEEDKALGILDWDGS